jgi:hypothetical protein
MAEPISTQVLSNADEAVDRLAILEFIKNYNNELRQRLLDCEREASMAPANRDAVFLAGAFPIMNGVIHLRSDRGRLREATEWIRGKWNVPNDVDFDTFSVLSALTLIYVANQGWRARTPENEEQWKSIMTRMRKLSEEMDPDAASQGPDASPATS